MLRILRFLSGEARVEAVIAGGGGFLQIACEKGCVKADGAGFV
jgi:hypothetical protein